MALLRSKAESALDAVLDLCQEAADEYRTASAASHDTELSHLFRDLEAKRREAVVFLRAAIRQMGNLPDAPDADREALEHLASRVKAIIAADARQSLLDDCRRLEEKLAAGIAAALQEDLPAAILELLRRLQKEAEWIRWRLTAAA